MTYVIRNIILHCILALGDPAGLILLNVVQAVPVKRLP